MTAAERWKQIAERAAACAARLELRDSAMKAPSNRELFIAADRAYMVAVELAERAMRDMLSDADDY